MSIFVNDKFVIQTLQQLVQIDSTNPTLSPENIGEAAVAAAIAQICRDLKLEVTVAEIAPGRPNVVAVLKGSGGGKSLLLNGHMDTVGVDGMSEPFSGEIRDGKLFGRGAQDMKGSLAAMIAAAKGIKDEGIQLKGDLILAFVADEEALSIGSADLVKHWPADAAIVTEPTDLTICRAHRGFIWYDVRTFGRAAHGSRYQEGIDANMRMGRFLAELDKLEKELRRRPPHDLAGPPSLHAAKIKGGTEISMYAAGCLLNVERRTIPGEQEAEASADMQAIIDKLAAEDDTFRAEVKATFVRDPFEVEEDAAIVQILDSAVTAYTGQQPAHTGQTFWTDAALHASTGVETVLIGPKGAGLHSVVEWVDVQSVIDLTHILAETAVKFCGVEE